MSNGLPIIRIELEGMRHSILTALAEHQVQVDAYVSDAIARFAAPEHLGKVIDGEVERAISEAVKEQLTSYFRFGTGRQFIADAVAARLSDKATDA